MLLTARYVLPISSPHIENGGVLVRNGRIADIGRTIALKVRYPNEPSYDFGLAALMPGLIDVHTHLEYTTMRGLVRDLPYAAWKEALTEKEELLSPQDWDDAAMLGGLEAVASGITTIADITRTGASGRAVDALGIRGVIYREVGTMEKSRIDDTMKEAAAEIEAWRQTFDPSRITPGIAPMSLMTCHPELLTRVTSYAADGTPVAVHLAGSKEECDFIRYGSSPFSVHNVEQGRGYGIDMPPWMPAGVSPVSYLLNWGLFDVPNLLAIHCVHVDEFDLTELAKHDVAVAYCPRCTAKLSMGIAPVRDMLRAGIRVGLGTDSPAGSDSMDLMEEMRLGLLLQRAIGDKRNWLDTTQMVNMATIDAARALRMEDRIGSLDLGKEADIIAVDLSNSHQAPTHDPNSAIVHTANQDNVMMTMVGGKIIYDGTHLHGVDPVEIRARAEEMRYKLRK